MGGSNAVIVYMGVFARGFFNLLRWYAYGFCLLHGELPLCSGGVYEYVGVCDHIMCFYAIESIENLG